MFPAIPFHFVLRTKIGLAERICKLDEGIRSTPEHRRFFYATEIFIYWVRLHAVGISLVLIVIHVRIDASIFCMFFSGQLKYSCSLSCLFLELFIRSSCVLIFSFLFPSWQITRSEGYGYLFNSICSVITAIFNNWGKLSLYSP